MIQIGNLKELPIVIPNAPCCIEEALDMTDCSKIQNEAAKNKLHKYQLEEYGSFTGTFIPYSDETAWIYGRLYDLALAVNKDAYMFDPLDMIEHIWYYEFNENDYMKWHTDIGPSSPFSGRKLSLILNLSNSDEYRGGQLLFNNGELLTSHRSLGTVNVFPGYLVNSVEKVTQGTKRIIVAWFGGENFR
jgi:PKHD-type hydroxylase